MALEVPEELIPLEWCLKKDHAKLKNGRPGTKAFEQSRLYRTKEKPAGRAACSSCPGAECRAWLPKKLDLSIKLLLLGEKRIPRARQWAAGAGQERRGTFGDFCENPRESGLVEGQEGNQGDTRKDNEVGDSSGSSEGQEQ